MKPDVFSYINYRIYLKDYLKSLPNDGHGFRSKIADTAGVQNAYVSKVFSGVADFSQEQGAAVSFLLEHNKDEQHFFLLLLNYERAGTELLKKYLRNQMEEVLKKRLNLKTRLAVGEVPLSESQKAKYYSSWHYMAIHSLCSLPAFQTRKAIFEKLRIDFQQLNEMIDFLISTGFIYESNSKLSIGMTRMHLGDDSPFLQSLHTQVRLKTIESLSTPTDNDLHYSSFITISKEDSQKVKSLLVRALEEIKLLIKSSQDEKASVMSLDFFDL